MPFLPLQNAPIGARAAAHYDAWLTSLDRALDDPSLDRNAFATEVLTGIWGPSLTHTGDGEVPLAGQVLRDQLDPRNVTLEAEYYSDIDRERFAAVKPLLWLWEMFDRSVLGENVALGVPFRRILARRIFRRCGANFKAFHQVKFSFGYNMEVGNNVVVHRHVLLDDRGGIRLGDGVSVSDYVNIYSHTHDLADGRIVYTPATVVEAGVRITYHATVLAGRHLGQDSLVGAGSILTRDTDPRGVYVGVPARKVKEKTTPADHGRSPHTVDPLADDPDPAPGLEPTE
jgi:acetyltransferase-like isoleucine patch superfamily enzyme